MGSLTDNWISWHLKDFVYLKMCTFCSIYHFKITVLYNYRCTLNNWYEQYQIKYHSKSDDIQIFKHFCPQLRWKTRPFRVTLTFLVCSRIWKLHPLNVHDLNVKSFRSNNVMPTKIFLHFPQLHYFVSLNQLGPLSVVREQEVQLISLNVIKLECTDQLLAHF